MDFLDWHDGSPDAAFSLARDTGKPLFLYWGASWCPPCNRIKGNVFGRADFAALADDCILLHIDGDGAGAQRMAERFKLRSYPTLVLYRPDGAEITRLPCELTPERFVEQFGLALAAPFTAAESLEAALGATRALGDQEWRMLAAYSWDTDERQLLRERDFATVAASLGAACTEPEAALRLAWYALHAAALGGKDGIDQRAAVARLLAVLADAGLARKHVDIVTDHALDLVRYLTEPQSQARVGLATAWAGALERLENDPTLNLGDQLAALRARVRMSRLGAAIPEMAYVARARVAAAAESTQEPAQRHQMINTGAGLLSDAGLLDAAEQLLKAELPRSHAPYYFMHNLAAIAKKRGDAARALTWYERAWEQASGPATRLQWGATYLQALIDFAPLDVARIERYASAFLLDMRGMDDLFSQRNRTQMQRIDSKLALWDGAGEAAIALRQAARSGAR